VTLDGMRQRDARIAALEAIPARARTSAEQEELGQLKGLIGDGLIQRRTTQRNHEPFVIIQLTQAGQSTLARA
jgi:hypothetical protein